MKVFDRRDNSKRMLLAVVRSKSMWRLGMESYFPTDDLSNDEAKARLHGLYQYLESLPLDHPVISWYSFMISEKDDPEQFHKGLVDYGYESRWNSPAEYFEEIISHTAALQGKELQRHHTWFNK